MKIAGLLALLGSVSLMVTATQSETPKSDKEKLQGAWVAKKVINAGGTRPENQAKKLRIVIKGDEWTLYDGAEKPKQKCRFALEADRQPKKMKLFVAFPGGKKPIEVVLGALIYSLEGDVLMIRTYDKGKPPPTDFQGVAKSSTDQIAVLHREKP